MGNRKNSLWLLLASLLIVGSGGMDSHVNAAPASKGLSISPFLQEQVLQPTETQKTFNLTLTNHTTQIQELDLQTKDFGSLNDTGGIILEGSKTYSQKYGLASWLSLEKDAVVLNPAESAMVLVTIDNRQSLQPGGHYGAIIASVNGQPQTVKNQVILQQQLVSLVLVNKVGGEHYDLKLVKIMPNSNWLHLPHEVRLRFQNPGNVHVIPRGLVKLKSPTGKVLAQGIINSESAYILPESFRELPVTLTSVRTQIPWPGIYHVEVDYRYEGIQKYAAKSVALRFINLGLYVLFAIALGLTFLLVKKRHQAK